MNLDVHVNRVSGMYVMDRVVYLSPLFLLQIVLVLENSLGQEYQ